MCLNNHRRDRGFGEGLAITRTSQGELKYGTRLDEGLNVTREEYKKHFIDVEKSMAKAGEEPIVNGAVGVLMVISNARKGESAIEHSYRFLLVRLAGTRPLLRFIANAHQ